MKAGNECPKCKGQMLPDESDRRDLCCVQCGYIDYHEQPVKDEDRRNLLDNRQAEKPYAEYKRALSEEEYRRMMEEIGIDDPTT